MTSGFEMFLLAADELNFSRAAERAFVTQQCLSDHIRRLEETYHVTLFQRKPKLELTPEGAAMRRYLSRIKAMEDSMINELSDINAGVRGTINFGVSFTRGFIIIPKVLPEFQKRFPNVDVQVHLGDTRELEPMLADGKLDVLLGVDAGQHALFNRKAICSEPVYLVISDMLLHTHFAEAYEKNIGEFLKGVDLKAFQGIPFVQGNNFSTTTYAINQYLLKNHIRLQIPIFVSNFDILLELCRTGCYATICPRFHVRQLIEMNRLLSKEKRLRIFPIRGFEHALSIEILTHRDARPLLHMTTFIDMLTEFLMEEESFVEEYLARQGVPAERLPAGVAERVACQAAALGAGPEHG